VYEYYEYNNKYINILLNYMIYILFENKIWYIFIKNAMMKFSYTQWLLFIKLFILLFLLKWD